MVHAVDSCKRIIRGESTFEGWRLLKLVEMNRTILDDCSQKRERRGKPIVLSNDDPVPRGRQASRKATVEHENVAKQNEQIKQKIKVPKFIQAQVQRSKVIKPIKVPKVGRGRAKKNTIPTKEHHLDSTDNSNSKTPYSKTKPETIAMQQESLEVEGPLRTNNRRNTASSVERYHHLPSKHDHKSSHMEDELEEVATSDKGGVGAHSNGVGQSSVHFREVMSDRGCYSFTKQQRPQDDLAEMSSVNCHSEADPIFTLEEHLSKLAENLSLVHKNKQHPQKDYIYKEVHRFVRNFLRFELDSELLVKKDLAKYLSVIYKLLLEINDSGNAGYSRLLPDASNLVTRIRKQLLAHVGLD